MVNTTTTAIRPLRDKAILLALFLFMQISFTDVVDAI
jgi:hypothetical protein